MSCLNNQPPPNKFTGLEEGVGLASAEATTQRQSDRRTLRLAYIAIAISVLVSLACLAACIAIGVDGQRQKDRLDALRAGIARGDYATGTGSIASSKAATPITPVMGASAFLVNDPKQVAGGYRFGGPLFAGSGYWIKMKDMIYQRSDHEVQAVNQVIYIIGGLSNTSTLNRTVLSAVTAYNTVSGNMYSLTPMPKPRDRFAAAHVDDKIYVMTGFDSPLEAVSLNTMHIYDIATDKWTVGPSSLIVRSDACAAAVNGKIYLAGGYDPSYNPLASVEVFDPATNTWTNTTDLPTPRGDLKCTNLNDMFYVVGGWNGTAFSAAVEVFDPVLQAWSKKAPMNFARGDLALVHLSEAGRLMAVGGETHNGTLTTVGKHNEVAMPSMEEYVAKDDVWVIKAGLPEPRFRFAATAVGEQVYVFGGHPTCNSEVDPNGCVRVALKSVY